jgi:hypothetical protein
VAEAQKSERQYRSRKKARRSWPKLVALRMWGKANLGVSANQEDHVSLRVLCHSGNTDSIKKKKKWGQLPVLKRKDAEECALDLTAEDIIGDYVRMASEKCCKVRAAHRGGRVQRERRHQSSLLKEAKEGCHLQRFGIQKLF